MTQWNVEMFYLWWPLWYNLWDSHETQVFTHVIGTSCFCSCGSRLSCCADITLTRAFLQEDDLGLWEEVGAGDDHLFSPTDQTAGQAGFLNLGQLLSWTLGWERRSGGWQEKRMIICWAVFIHTAVYLILWTIDVLQYMQTNGFKKWPQICINTSLTASTKR